ncbi:hypothetical protein LCGC14_2191850 [marine sediment metagenome]
MMSMKATVPNMKNKTFSSLILPYKNERYQMFVFLPNHDNSTADIVSEISLDNLNYWLDTYTESVLDISFPKFKMEYTSNANASLTNLGLGIAFSNDADFGKINNDTPLKIRRVVQKTFIVVDEDGTDAAAVT